MESDRMIVVVTGANAGIGLGICHRLLSALSLPLSQPITEAIPQSSAFDPSEPLSSSSPGSGSSSTGSQNRIPIKLTLILACRSLKKAQAAKEEILEKHLKSMAKRRKQGWEEPQGWREGLRIEVELLDTDSPMGENGILDFCERLKQRYPYITTLFSNAGVHAAIGQPRWGALILELFRKGPFYALSHDKAYMDEEVGRLSRDKERGAIWGINTFATYLLANELLPLLHQSPTAIPFSPRIVYTTTSTTELSDSERSDPTDRQLRRFRKVYAPSKYAADLLINDFDRRHGPSEKSGRGVRAITAEPGCVSTNAAKDSIVDSPLFGLIMFANGLVFTILRLLGSPWHPRDTQDSTAALLYAALVPNQHLPSPTTSTRWKLGIRAHPLRDATVDYKALDGGDTAQAEEILKGQLEECEKVREECKRAQRIDG